jgi:hypothetical protein
MKKLMLAVFLSITCAQAVAYTEEEFIKESEGAGEPLGECLGGQLAIKCDEGYTIYPMSDTLNKEILDGCNTEYNVMMRRIIDLSEKLTGKKTTVPDLFDAHQKMQVTMYKMVQMMAKFVHDLEEESARIFDSTLN